MKIHSLTLCPVSFLVLVIVVTQTEAYPLAAKFRSREGNLDVLEPDFRSGHSENSIIKGTQNDRWGPSPLSSDDELSELSEKNGEEVLSTGKDVDSLLAKELSKNVQALRRYLASRGLHQMSRRRSEKSAVLPPWQEFCKMLNMAECSRFKRSLMAQFKR